MYHRNLLWFPKKNKIRSYKHVSDKSIKCLSVILEFCPSSVICLYPRSFLHVFMQWPAISTKSQVYYHNRSSMRRIFDFRDRFSGQFGNAAPCLKNNITKMSCICVWQHIFSPNFHKIYDYTPFQKKSKGKILKVILKCILLNDMPTTFKSKYFILFRKL